METLGLAKDLFAPKTIRTTSVYKLIEALTTYFAPKPIQLSHHIDFFNQKQRPQEPATEFLATLRKLASKCGFQKLQEILLLQFSQGQSNGRLRQKLATTEDITLKKTMAMTAATDQVATQGHQPKIPATAGSSAVHQQKI